MPQPITADEGDANLDWVNQKGTTMPSPYPSTKLNAVSTAQMPTAAQMAQIGVDISTVAKLKAYYRFVGFTD